MRKYKLRSSHRNPGLRVSTRPTPGGVDENPTGRQQPGKKTKAEKRRIRRRLETIGT